MERSRKSFGLSRIPSFGKHHHILDMKVFVTGGTGWVGGAVIRELVANAHVVTALVRTPKGAAEVEAAGAVARTGDIADLENLRQAATEHDAVVHCAFRHEFGFLDGLSAVLVRLTRNPNWATLSTAGGGDLRAIEAMIDGLSRSRGKKVFLATSGIAGLLPGRVGAEKDRPHTSTPGAIRIASELATLAAGAKGVRSAAIRLPPSVHGAGDKGFVPTLMDCARRSNVSAFIGTGENRWSAVHRDDAATLYRLAIEGLAEGSVPPGSVLHGVGESAVPFRELADAVAHRLGLGSAESRKRGHFPMFVGMFAELDLPATSDVTRKLTGWQPVGPRLVDDVRGSAYAPRA